MDMFEYVFVLTSIIIGLALTHILQGVAGLVQHPGRDKVWWVHLVWVTMVFFTLVFWWWWQFRYVEIRIWTFPLYLFIISYSFIAYLGAALLFPKDLDGYDGFKDYFLTRRSWFFSIIALWYLADILDTWLKGPEHFATLGLKYVATNTALAALAVGGIFIRDERYQGAIALLFLVYMTMLAWIGYATVA